MALLALLMIGMNGCFDYYDVEFKGVQNVSVVERTENDLKLQVDVRINNPNTYNIKIKKSVFDIYINDRLVGKTNLAEKVILKKKTEDVYGIVLNANARDLLKAAMGSLGGLMKGTVKIGIKGDVKGSVYGVTKKVPIDVEENINLKEFL